MAARSGDESLFRATATGREPLAPPGQSGFHVHVPVARHCGIGVTTSIRGTGPVVRQRMSDLEYLSLVTGVPVRELMRRR